MRNLTAEQLKDYLETADPKPVLLDVREPWEYKVAHLSDSILIPMRQLPSSLNALDPNQEIVVICHHGMRSCSVARYLEQNEYQNVINLQGGIDAWAKTVDPSMPKY